MKANLNFDKESPLYKNREEALKVTQDALEVLSKNIEEYVNSMAALGYYSYFSDAINSLFSSYELTVKSYKALSPTKDVPIIELKLF